MNQDSAPSTPGSTGLPTREELEAFFDGIIGAQRESYHIPGAAVAVVKGGEICFLNGYGWADIIQQRPVDARETLFRIGSVTKLFTWKAVMQFVEQGKLDLHADVNSYLREFQIPATYPRPITLAHLLTHTPGFEARDFGAWARDPAVLAPIGSYLAQHIPARVYPPGTIAAYSNYGVTLAAYICEQVSGLPWEQYLERFLFEPLAMHHTSARQPLPPELAPKLATCYTYARGRNRPSGFEYIQYAPAGAMSASPADIAQFMIAHLQRGRYGDQRILQEATAEEMQQQQFTTHPGLSGMAYGFWRGERYGRQLIYHGGWTVLGSLNELVLFPEEQVGLYVVYNSSNSHEAYWRLRDAFLARYLARPDTVLRASGPSRIGQYAGSYRYTYYSHTTWEKLPQLLVRAAHLRVKALRDGTLRPSAFGPGFSYLSGEGAAFVETEREVFQQREGQSRLAFDTDRRGRATRLFLEERPTMAYTKLAWYETSIFHFCVLVTSLALSLSALLWWPPGVVMPGFAGAARWLVVGASGLNLLFLIGLLGLLARPQQLLYGATRSWRIVLRLPMLSAALTFGSLVCVGVGWFQGDGSLIGRIHTTLVTLALLGFVWQVKYWNMLGFRLRF